NARQLYSRIAIFPASATANQTLTLDRQAAFPQEMRVTPGTNETTADGKINHPWSGDSAGTVTVVVVGAGSTSSTFGVHFTKMPKKACISMATKLSGGEISNLSGLVINGTTNGLSSLPLTLITAATQCTSDTDNIMEWQFNLRG